MGPENYEDNISYYN